MQISFSDVEFGYTRRKPVFTGLSLHLDRFPVAVLGPNGSGKSTLLALIAGRLTPDRGEILVDDSTGAASSRRRGLRELTGWMPQEIPALRGFTVREYIAYCGWLKGMRRGDASSAAESIVKMAAIADLIDTPVRTLSGGQRRRLGLACAAVHSPAVLVLDEPYAGLDPEQRTAVRMALQGMRDETALVVSTHQTEDLDDSYESVIVMDGGRVLFSGDVDTFLSGVPEDIHQAARAEAAYRSVVRGVPTRPER